MDISGISVNDTAFGQASSRASQDLDRGSFMQLLVAQLQNQDPLSPTANEDFLAQLSQFSSLEQLEQLNGSIGAMIGLNQSNALLSQLTQGSALIGKEVIWTDFESGAELSGSVDSVKLRDGIAFLNVDGVDVPLASVSEIVGEGIAEDGDDATGPDPGDES